MKRFVQLLLAAVVLSVAPAFYILKGKEKKPSDGVERKFKSKPVKKPVTVKVCEGIEYKLLAKGDGPQPKTGDRVSVLYMGTLLNDTVFDASYKHGNVPYQFHLNQQNVIAGWDSVISRLHAGDKALLTIAPQYAYGAMARGKIPANSTLKFEIEIIDVQGKPTPWNAKGKDTITTASGLKIVMFESRPDSAQPKTGQKLVVDYSGFLTDSASTMFDSSVDRGQPYVFPLGGRVIKGWNEAFAILRKGEKAKLIIPSSLAYGPMGNGPIPANATIVFDVHLIDIKN